MRDPFRGHWGHGPLHMFKTEVINQIGPWKSMREVEWETLKWVDWYNNPSQVHSNLWRSPARPARPYRLRPTRRSRGGVLCKPEHNRYGRLAACRTGFKNLAFSGVFASLGGLRVPLALGRSLHGALPVVWHGRAGVNCPYPAYPSLNMRLRFHAIVTRLHSPRAFSRPRIENWRNPSTDLMIPKTGSAVCLRSA